MTFPLIQTSFISGELTPSLLGRVDKPQYKNGASTMRNFVVNYKGGAMSRAGFAYVGMCKQGAPNSGGTATSNPPRDINFQYNINQGYALEFGDQYMRVKYRGAYVTESAKAISGATNANPLVITDTGHGYSNGDWVYITGMGGMTELNGLTWVVTNTTTNTYHLTDLFGNAVNSTGFGTYTSGGISARIYTVVSPYAAIDLKYLKFTESANTMNLVCWNQDTLTEYPPYNLQRLGQTNWVFTVVDFDPVIGPPSTISSTATSSTTANTWYSYVVTAVDSKGNESVASANTDVLNNNISINAGTNTITWSAVAGAVTYNVYAATPAFTLTPFDDPGFAGVSYGLVGTAFGTQFIDTNITADFTKTPPLHSDPFARGAITNVTPIAPGSGYVPGTIGYTVNTTTGSGFSGTPMVVGGQFVAFIINDGGKNYLPTDTITITGSGTGSTFATGSLTFTGNPASGQTVIINGVTITFVTVGAVGNQVNIGSSTAIAVNNLQTFLSGSSNSSLNAATYGSPSNVLTITYKTPGTAGNSFTLGVGTAPATRSGATLTGGTSSSGATASITVGPSTGTYPGVVQYYQQRLVYADTENQPDTYFMSQPGLYTNFDASIPVIDSDAIIGTPWGVQINGIQFMVPSIQGLLAFTGNGVWLINGGNSAAITPSDQNAQAQAQIGCSAFLPPLYINLHVLYAQAKNSIVRDIAFNFLYNVFQGTDITILSNHLFFGYTLVQWAYAEEPFKVVWAVRNDGKLLSLTYIKEQEVEGWSRHDTDGLFIGVCSVIEPPVDAIYVITKRYIIGHNVWVYYSERADDRQWANIEDAFCVDAGLSLPITFPDAILTPAAAEGTNNISSVNLISGGTGYTSPIATAVDSSGRGTGATFSVTVGGGIITAVTPLTQGTLYTQGLTQIIITDATGVGAVIQPVITNYVTFTASSSIFNSGMIGDVLRVDGGKATIISQTGTACVANITQPLTLTFPDNPTNSPVPAISGTWSVSTPITQINGLNHLEGMIVTGLADGGVIVPQTVANGAITLQNSSSAITVGLPYTCQLQTFPLDPPAQTTTQGKRGNIQAVTVRVEQTRGIEIGSNQPDASTQPNQATVPWTNLIEVKERNALITAGSAIPLMTGDTLPILIPGQWDERKQVAVQARYPLPCTVLAVIPRMSIGDQSG